MTVRKCVGTWNKFVFVSPSKIEVIFKPVVGFFIREIKVKIADIFMENLTFPPPYPPYWNVEK